MRQVTGLDEPANVLHGAVNVDATGLAVTLVAFATALNNG